MAERPTRDAATAPGGIAPGEAVRLASLVEYGAGAIVSRTLEKGPGGILTLFAFDAGQELSEHSTPYEAYVIVLEGLAQVTVAGRPARVAEGETVRMPADVPHSVAAPGRFKMLLVMLKNPRA